MGRHTSSLKTQKCAFPRGSGPNIIHSSFDTQKSAIKRHLDRFSRFCTAHPYAQRTDKQTTIHVTAAVAKGSISCSACRRWVISKSWVISWPVRQWIYAGSRLRVHRQSERRGCRSSPGRNTALRHQHHRQHHHHLHVERQQWLLIISSFSNTNSLATFHFHLYPRTDSETGTHLLQAPSYLDIISMFKNYFFNFPGKHYVPDPLGWYSRPSAVASWYLRLTSIPNQQILGLFLPLRVSLNLINLIIFSEDLYTHTKWA